MILAMLFGSPPELAIIAGVVVLLFGGNKIAGWGKNLGEGLKEFKKATKEEPTAADVPPAVVVAPVQTVKPAVAEAPPVTPTETTTRVE
jgi:sec-independent protein translocase protein TatA